MCSSFHERACKNLTNVVIGKLGKLVHKQNCSHGFLFYLINYSIIIVQVRYKTIETKEIARMGYNMFLFPHEYCRRRPRCVIYNKKKQTQKSIRMNCFRYLKLMSPLNATICTTTYLERQKCNGPGKKILFKKQLFDLEVNGQDPTKVITVCDTPPYGHAPTYQTSLTYLERQMLWP